MITMHLRISGRVQGVGFRYAMRAQARVRGVCGWVRNRNDGTVEAMLHGTRESVDALVAWARTGPTGAAVTDLQVHPGSGAYIGFDTRATE